MTSKEQEIYNTYLRVSRTALNQPWRPRKDFSNFDEKDTFYIQKLGMLFNKFPQINIEDFFIAPFVLYPDEKYLDLKFFISQKAINAYSIYNKQKEQENPDNPNQLNFIRESMTFIGNFCKNQGIKLKEYIEQKSGLSPYFAVHYAEKKVSIYSLIHFSGFEQAVYSLPEDQRSIFFHSESPNFSKFKTRLHLSSQAKSLLQIGFNRIDIYLKSLQ